MNIIAKATLEVVFVVKKSGVKVTKTFDSYYACRTFVNKLRHSKTCLLVSYPALG